MNKGNMNFETLKLPWQAQLTSYKCAVIVNANNDNKPDILLMGNYYDSNIEMGQYDADYGTLLVNNGYGNFTSGPLNGLIVKGQIRHMLPIVIKNKQAIILAKNNDSTHLIQIN